MNRYIVILTFGLLGFQDLTAQLLNELYAVTQRDLVYWNPAAIGLDSRPSVGLIYREINFGLDAAPLNYAANIQWPVRFQNSAFSAVLSKDFLGDQRQNALNLGYRYSIFNHRLDDQRLYAGISVDFKHQRLFGTNFFFRDELDPLIPVENRTKWGIDVNAGLFYKLYIASDLAVRDQYISAGFSVNRIRSNPTVFQDSVSQLDRPRQWFAFAEWEIDMEGFLIDARSFLTFGGQNTNLAVLLGIKDFSYLSVSAGYRTSQDLILSLGFDMTDFDDSALEVDLNYFYSLNEVVGEQRNGVQISVRYLFKPRPWTTSDFR